MLFGGFRGPGGPIAKKDHLSGVMDMKLLEPQWTKMQVRRIRLPIGW